MSNRPLIWLADAFRKNGLRVKEVQGWKTRGRPGTFAPRGVIFHHTASASLSAAPSLGVVTKGRPDLTGPLCNVLVGRDGTVHLIAAGRSNHAGFGGPIRNIPKNSGNSFLAGVEVENNGKNEPWNDKLLDTLDVVFATMLIGLRRDPNWLIGHKEWTARKPDPHHLDMAKIRARVRRQARVIAQGKASPANDGIYVVKTGDTLFSIGLRHGMSVAELMKVNGLESTVLHPGDKLKVRIR